MTMRQHDMSGLAERGAGSNALIAAFGERSADTLCPF
jgi:hypothetical protein